MKHCHQPISHEQAHALLSCHGLALTFRECGAFRLNERERWVRPYGPPPEELTAAEVARRLHCHRTPLINWPLRGEPLRQSQTRS